MNIAITGSSGFIGKQLEAHFRKQSDSIINLPRINDETSALELSKILSESEVIINLAGAPIVGRWDEEYKKSLFDSRINTTRKIVDAIGLMETKPKVFISASAIGIYSQEGEQTENQFLQADDYLGYICSNWENEAKQAASYTRVAISRFGIVLGKGGGALQRMLPVFKFGLGGKIASGKQGFSWIHIQDMIRAVQYIIDKPDLKGEFNFTAPEVLTNEIFTKILAGVLKRPAIFSVPAFALKLIFGEGAIAVTGGQFAPPKHLLSEGFQFTFPELEEALVDIVR